VKNIWVFDQFQADVKFDKRASVENKGGKHFSGNREKWKQNNRSFGACSNLFESSEKLRHSTPRPVGAPDRRDGRGNLAGNIPLEENGGKPEYSAADPNFKSDRNHKIKNNFTDSLRIKKKNR